MRALAWPFAGIVAILSLSICLQATNGTAAEFSSEPIRFIVGYPAGGSTDIAARLIVDKVSAETGRRFIVDNRPGASGIVGAGVVANAAPDAQMLLFAASPEVALARALNRKIDYDPQVGFRPITLIGKVPFMLAINIDVPAQNLQEFITYVRKNPGTANFASFGIGTSNHLFSEYFKALTSTDIVHIPYKGSAPAITDLLGGRIQMVFDTVPVLLPYIKSGQLRALGVAMDERSPLAPEVPTLAEAGLPGLVGGTWFGVFGPSGMASDRVAYLNRILTQALTSPDIRKTFIERGIIPSPTTPDGLGDFVMDEVRRWSEIAQRANISIE
jgi:tripartite-type tricarboxylate transporter receptor subunit TctC